MNNSAVPMKLDAIRLASAYFPAIYCPIMGVLYVLTLFPIIRFPKRYKNAFYSFIFVLGIADIYNLLVDPIFSAICYLNFKCPGPHWLRYFKILKLSFKKHVSNI